MLGKIEAGKRYGRWTAIAFSHKTATAYFWNCRCECGVEKVVRCGDLRNGKSISCGCFSRETTSRIKKTHGQSLKNSEFYSEYKTWKGIKARCYRKTSSDYYLYGGRGIRVCKRWLHSFKNFLKDMGKKPSPTHSIERKNVDKNYTPANCKWGTSIEQGSNKRNNVRYLFNGKNLTLPEWERKIGTPASCLYDRIFRGWTLEKTFTTPSRNAKTKI